MGFLKPKTPTVQALPNQVLQPTQTPIQGSQPIGGSQAPSFLASITLPPPQQQNQGGKALLGQ